MKKQRSDLCLMLGDINFESYERIEADARNLQEQLQSREQSRDKIRGAGRLPGENITLVEVRIRAVALLRECSVMHVPPPPELVEIFDQTIGKNLSTSTSELRKKQFEAAAKAEAVRYRLCDLTDEKHEKWDIVYEVDITEVARISGADRKTVREWRQKEEYAQAVIEVVAQKITERLAESGERN